MKKRLVVILAIVLAVSFFAFRFSSVESKPFQTPEPIDFSELKPQVSQAVKFAETENLRDIIPAQKDNSTKFDGKNVRVVSENLPKQKENGTHDQDAALAKNSLVPMPAPSLSFDGLISMDNANAYNAVFIPPDMNGDVGPNHYVQIVNSLIRIYNKNGTALTPPFKISTIFAQLNTSCSTRDDGLPVVLYDALADRWMISQYCNFFPPFRQMVAVSKTGDPTSAYYAYEFVMPNVRLNDFGKFGVWTDGYYMATDEFIGAEYYGSGAFAFDRAKMLVGDATASYIYFSLPSANAPNRLGNLLPADLDGLNAPPAGFPNIFAGYSATEYGEAQDAIRLFDFRANFANPFSSTFTERAGSPLAVPAFDPTSPPDRMDIFQPAPGEALDSQSDRLMYRAAYRNFGTHDSLVLNQTVRITPANESYRAGIRIYELRRNLIPATPSTPFTVHEAATLNGNGDGVNRWIGSAAQDHQGNLAIGYTYGNQDKKPSIYYTGKLSTEPAGTFRDEAALVEGTGVQTAFGFRWGDYASMSIDPSDDCSFWLTHEYYTLESQDFPFGWLTRIGRFKFDECTPAPRAMITGFVTNATNGAPLANAVISANAVYTRVSGANGSYGNMTVLPNTYVLTASAKGFRTQTISVTLTDGQTLTQNFALQPVAVLENTATQITSESCGINNAAEPGETVTLNISLRNTGERNTVNLTATLFANGGVTNPSSAQNYGAIPVGGASVSRPFTFTVSQTVNCGGIVNLTLQLQDGTENLGTLVIPLQTGVQRVSLQENFDSVTAPELPAGWTTNATGAQQNWRTSTARFQTAPNSVYSLSPNQIGLNELVSPAFSVVSPNAELTFRNWYEFETTFLRNRLYDGGVLEIKIGNNAFQDIEVAGGVFLTGGYDGIIDGCCQNPLAGRRGWSGRSGINQTSEFITSKVKLPASAAGQNVQFRWRIGNDIGGFREGQYLDNLVVSDGFVCSCALAQRAPFDFDGDGKTDLAVFRPSNGTWYVLRSSNGGVTIVNFGLSGDKPVAGDFDGDGRADFAVFRPSNGVWYLLRSTAGFTAAQFGIASDKPLQADFDGDGRRDIGVFRPSTGVWYYIKSSNSEIVIRQFGLSNDVAVPSVFVN